MKSRVIWYGLTAFIIAHHGFQLGSAHGEPRGTFKRRDNVQIPMSDGIRLSADLYLPKGKTAVPVVLVRTPYGKRQLGPYLAEPLAKKGYAVVMQDVRGMGGSGGMHIPFIHEKKDGMKTLDWIAKQTWCDGNVGMWGSSYLGYCAMIVAPEQHPALKAIFNISSWANTEDMTSPGGAMHLMITVPWTLSRQIRGKGSLSDFDWPTAFRHIPVTDIPASLGVESPVWEGAVAMFTSDFLSQTASVSGRYDRIRTPIFHLTGWHDFVARLTLDAYEGVDQARFAKNERPTQELMVGAWYHDQQWGEVGTRVGDEDFGPASAMDIERIVDLTVRWFDHWLKGVDNGVTKDKPVKLFVMGPNQWRSFERWPPRRVEFQKWFIDSERGANSLHGDGRLSTILPSVDGNDTFTYDPMNPVPTTGGANCHFFPKTLGIRDQRPVEKRKDVLVYTSAPLKRDLTLIGPLQAVVYAATTGRHTDFTAKLVEVRSDGYARIIEDGIRRGPDSSRLRQLEPMTPDKVYRFTIDLGATGLVIPAGNRVRVEISSSNFPKYTRNPNTGEPPEAATVFESVTQRIYHSNEYPSHVVLPVLASSD